MDFDVGICQLVRGFSQGLFEDLGQQDHLTARQSHMGVVGDLGFFHSPLHWSAHAKNKKTVKEM